MTDRQWVCTGLLAERVPEFSTLRCALTPHGDGVALTTTRSWLSGLDGDLLTELAIEASRRRLRLQVDGDRSGRLRLAVLPVDATALPAGTGKPAALTKTAPARKNPSPTPSLF
jgi:hypothetical protein